MINDWKCNLILKGKYYGYPECCIAQFIDDLFGGRNISELREKAGRGTGFIPCNDCAVQVLVDKVPLDSLIKNRMCNTEFPIGLHDGKH